MGFHFTVLRLMTHRTFAVAILQINTVANRECRVRNLHVSTSSTEDLLRLIFRTVSAEYVQYSWRKNINILQSRVTNSDNVKNASIGQKLPWQLHVSANNRSPCAWVHFACSFSPLARCASGSGVELSLNQPRFHGLPLPHDSEI